MPLALLGVDLATRSRDYEDLQVEPGAENLPFSFSTEALFDDFEGFARAFTFLLDDYDWRGDLDAFNDVLRGGFGTPEDGEAGRAVPE